MILDKNIEHASMIGDVSNVSSMRMNLNANSFELILSKLYNNPLGAVFRELVTNAYEATQLAKSDKKVCIQLPFLLNTDLVIRDFGTGLNKEEIDKYLNCLFSSSKSESNEFAGGFGLTISSPNKIG